MALIKCNGHDSDLPGLMQSLNEAEAQRLLDWIRQQTNAELNPFENAWLETELESLAEFHPERIGEK